MARPSTREDFIQNCLRRLGKTAIAVEVTKEQIEDRVDEALDYYWDYHFDGAEKIYYKHQLAENNKSNAVYQVKIDNGGIGYANGESLVFTGSTTPAVGTITTDVTGKIVSINLTAYGEYAKAPPVTVNTVSGTGAILTSELGGFINLPENINGVVKVFSIGDALNTNNMFNIRYQIALNDLYTLTNVSIVPYYMAMQHIRVLEEVLVGQTMIRYNRHRNRLYLDIDWARVDMGKYVLVEAYEVVDPEVYNDVWKDRWLLRYCTALIKRQQGTNLKKFNQPKIIGGITFSGQTIYDEAVAEINALEEEMINSYSLPATDFIG